MENNDLRVDNVSVSFGLNGSRTEVLHEINLEVTSGSFLSIIGPSGCGKSTLLNVIAGFILPSAGQVTVGGRMVVGPGPDRAVVHQQTAALLPWLNVRSNVGLGLKVKNITLEKYNATVTKYLELVGLSEFGEHAIYEISGGMQQRVALARALAVESPIVLLDEPLGALDALQRQLMQDFLLSVWAKTRRTFILITHSVEEAAYLSSEVIVMSPRPGRIVVKDKISFGEEALKASKRNVKTRREFVAYQNKLLTTLMSFQTT